MKKIKKYPDFIHGLTDSSRITADIAVEAIKDNPDFFKQVLDISFQQEYPINMRSARVVQLCCKKNPAFIVPYLNNVIEKIIISEIDGVRRNFLKIIAEYIDFNLVKDNVALFNICFKWLLLPDTATAIKHHCLQILEKFCKKEPTLIHEYEGALHICIEQSTKTIQNKALKILKNLSNLKEDYYNDKSLLKKVI